MKDNSITKYFTKQYDFVFISHLPSFYKINIFNKIAEKSRILVIFLGETSIERTIDFVTGKMAFDYYYLNTGHFETRRILFSSIYLLYLLRHINYKLISVGAWDLPESWVAIMISPKSKNVITQESSIFESKNKGWKSIFKRVFVQRLSLSFVSGVPHERLMRSVGFNGQIVITGGVGLPNRAERQLNTEKGFNGKFLYVGRLSPEKNIEMLLSVFAAPEMSAYSLTIVGSGTERERLRHIASSNVVFIDHVPNDVIQHIYATHDIFILASTSEPWGLVVEEALYYGLPVLASSYVGCAEDLIVKYGSGLLFDPYSKSSCIAACSEIISQYKQYSVAVRAIDFADRDYNQVKVYLDAITERSTL